MECKFQIGDVVKFKKKYDRSGYLFGHDSIIGMIIDIRNAPRKDDMICFVRTIHSSEGFYFWRLKKVSKAQAMLWKLEN
jgi:hypothetical protein